MAERYKRYEVVARVISQKGFCGSGHKAGDEWVIGRNTPDAMCEMAYHTLLPFIWVLAFDGSLPWYPDPHIAEVACPDGANPVIFELRRGQKIGIQ